ncbi:MAG TPA: SOS response-associated peptidase [Acidimicrobiia bacterium]|nr:SOS response-associated peptidase [Acidimicrobiia bacterium]
MCGRFVAASSPTLLAERFHVEEQRATDGEPDYNVAPRTEILTVRDRPGPDHPTRVLSRLRWGLVPTWADDPSIGDRMINARAETVLTKPAYRRSFAKRRCIIPADGFYEWRRLPAAPGASTGGKEPTFIRRRDGEPLAFAGLWSVWKVPDHLAGTVGGDDGWLRTCAIVTTRANDLLAPIHDRMPVVLPEVAWDRWLDPRSDASAAELRGLSDLLVPAPDDWFELYAVSPRVNQAVDHDAALIRPVGETALP